MAISFTRPIDIQDTKVGLEDCLAKAVQQVFSDELQSGFNDLINYGTPHLGSSAVVERFAKQDGLLVLRRPITSDVLMRIIYANWSGIASERGLSFLQFVLRMIWGDEWRIKRFFHSIDYAEQYPKFLTFNESAKTFLTSRIFLEISSSVDAVEVSELAPMLRRLVPANIVASVGLENNIYENDKNLGVGIGLKLYNIVDLS